MLKHTKIECKMIYSESESKADSNLVINSASNFDSVSDSLTLTLIQLL